MKRTSHLRGLRGIATLRCLLTLDILRNARLGMTAGAISEALTDKTGEEFHVKTSDRDCRLLMAIGLVDRNGDKYRLVQKHAAVQTLLTAMLATTDDSAPVKRQAAPVVADQPGLATMVIIDSQTGEELDRVGEVFELTDNSLRHQLKVMELVCNDLCQCELTWFPSYRVLRFGEEAVEL